jgi:NtrC-family two-component system sensor histidine kinase KinB
MTEALRGNRDRYRRSVDELVQGPGGAVEHYFAAVVPDLVAVERSTNDILAVNQDAMVRKSSRARGIVDDLLDLSRIQSGRIEVNARAVQSRVLLQTTIDQNRGLARDQGVGLALGAPRLDRAVLADPDRLNLVLTNLVSNAIRHTPAGGDVQLRTAPERDGQVRFEVTDTGEGMDPKWFPLLFDRFFRIPGSKPGNGVGLGLYICKEIVEAHGGHIGVESEPGHGSVLWFTLPSAPQSEPSAAVA